jgi:hypothetical protein
MTTNSNFIRMNHLKTVIEEIMCNPPKALPEKAHKKELQKAHPSPDNFLNGSLCTSY